MISILGCAAQTMIGSPPDCHVANPKAGNYGLRAPSQVGPGHQPRITLFKLCGNTNAQKYKAKLPFPRVILHHQSTTI